MKKKFLAILLGALMLVTMLPVSGIVTSAAAIDVPNLDFEDEFTKFAGKTVPSDTGWELVGESVYNPGTPYRLTSDTITVGGEEVTINPASAESTAFLKLVREPELYSSDKTGREVRLTYTIPAGTLTVGKQYLFKYSYYIPADATDSTVASVRVSNANNSNDGPMVAGLSSANKATGGWVTDAGLFTCAEGTTYYVHLLFKSGALDAFSVYFDDVSIEEYRTNNLLPNGEFELGLATSANNVKVPAGAWTTVWVTTPANCSVERVSKNVFATPVASSNYSLKLTQVDTSTFFNLNYAVNNSVLTAGKYYTMEFYYNIPTASGGVGVNIGFFTDDHYNTESFGNNKGAVAKKTTATDGWTKYSYSFYYDGTASMQFRIGMRGAAAGTVLYVDEAKLYEDVPPATTTLHAQNFQAITSAVVNNPTGGYNTRTSRGTLEVVADPVAANAGNMVMKVHASNTSNPVASMIPMATADGTAPLGTFADGDIIKISYRVYVPAQAYGEDKNTSTDGFNFGAYYNDNTLRYSSSAVSLGAGYTDRWLNFESYISAFQSTTGMHLRFYSSFVGDFYIDDIDVGKIDNGGYISDMNVENMYQHPRAAGDGGHWSQTMQGNYDATVSATSTVCPVVAFTPGNTTASGLAINALYKVENGKRTLKDIKIDTVSHVGKAAMTNIDLANAPASIGMANDNLKFNLAEMNLEAGSYVVETFLWNSALAPISAGRTVTFTK